MERKLKLPIGIENFEKIRKEGFYYVDKTSLIRDLLNNSGEVNLFTRPRRFGKSLNMSMLKYFFEYGSDQSLFDGLEIAADAQICKEHMGKYPVISISLKDVNGRNFSSALAMLRTVIGWEAMRFQFLADSEVLTPKEKASYDQLVTIDSSNRQGFIMPEEVITSSLLTLCRLLHKHYGQKAVLLIDEYDVPLDKAQHFGYYEEMISLIRNLFSQALKSNHSLNFAVLTGCLRVSKESIFTGMNNLKVFSITNAPFDEKFGFTDSEVQKMTEYYGCNDKIPLIKEWYDGYRFGDTDVYCPWDVLNYVDLLRSEPNALPRAFWINTSGNDIIRNFIGMAKAGTRKELECLINGEAISKKINQELTYRDLYTSIDNHWSILFTTGYLTQRNCDDGEAHQQPSTCQQPDIFPQVDTSQQTDTFPQVGTSQQTDTFPEVDTSWQTGTFPQVDSSRQTDGLPQVDSSRQTDIYQQPNDVLQLVIPNLEIRKIFIDQIMEWFQQEARKDTPMLDAFCKAFSDGDAETAETMFNAYLKKVISIRDTSVRKNKKENFYHGILLGLLSHEEDWYIRSNMESGDGYSDILIEIEEESIGIVIEVKYPDDSKKIPDAADLEKGCKEALEQIELLNYEEALRQEGLETILKYGIACNRKKCRVLLQRN